VVKCLGYDPHGGNGSIKVRHPLDTLADQGRRRDGSLPHHFPIRSSGWTPNAFDKAWIVLVSNTGTDGITNAAKNLLKITNFYQTNVPFERMMI